MLVIGGAPPSHHSSLMRAIRGSSGLQVEIRSQEQFHYSLSLPVNSVVILVCSVAAISCLVVIEEEKVDASLR